MDDSDLELFDQFVEKHWNKTFGADNKVLDKNEKINIEENETMEEQPKRRGRKPKTETELI